MRTPPGNRTTGALNVALALASTALVLLALETGLRVWPQLRDALRGASPCASPRGGELNQINTRSCEAARAAGIPFDRRSRLEVIRALEGDGMDAVPAVHAISFLDSMPSLDGDPVLPLGGIANALTVYCNESGEYVTFRSDEFGFRNPVGRHTRDVRIALVGDSFTKGLCAADPSTIAGVLDARFGGLLNLGIDGNGPLLTLASVREYVTPLEPELVLWFFFEGNDLRNLEREKSHPIVSRYLDVSFRQNLRERRPRIDSVLRAVVRGERSKAERQLSGPIVPLDALRRFVLLERLRSFVHNAVTRAQRPAAPFDSLAFRAAAAMMQRDVARWGGQLRFVYLPAWERFANGSAHPHHADVLSIIAELGIPALDLVPVFERQPDPTSLFPFGIGGHYTAEGYSLVGDAVARWLDREALRRRPLETRLDSGHSRPLSSGD